MLHKNKIKDKLLKGGLWAFSGAALMALASLAINMLLTRLLNPEDMGAYFLTLSMVSVATMVAQLGLTQTIVRLIAESMGTGRPGRARTSILLVLRIVAVSTLIVAGLVAFGSGRWIARQLFHSEIMAQGMGLAALWVVMQSFQRLMAEIYRGFHDIRLATLFGGLTTSVISMALFWLLWNMQGKGSLDQVLVLAVGAGFVSVLISSMVLWNTLSKLQATDDKVELAGVLSISWPLWITSLALFVLIQTDIWILGLFSSPNEVAVYGAASRLVAFVAMPLMIANAVVPPLISEMHAQEKIQELEKTLRAVATAAGIPSLIVLGVLVFSGNYILGLLFGNYYKSGGIVLAILSIGQVANVWTGSCGQLLMLTGHQATMMKITIMCGLLTALLAWRLVLVYGGTGVAIAASSGMVLQNILMLVSAKKRTGVWTHVDPTLVSDIGWFRGRNN